MAAPRPDKKLFTPGPLSSSRTVKEAMLFDLGSRDAGFIDTVKTIRTEVLKLAGVDASEFTTIPMQGSGTFAIEATISTSVPRSGGKVLVLENGAYGKRIKKICDVLQIYAKALSFPENQIVDPAEVDAFLEKNSDWTHVCMVHCETSAGVLNPHAEVGRIVKKHLPSSVFFVDAMSSFGAIPLDFSNIDYMVSSSNKCIQGVPGFGIVIARLNKLLPCAGWARSLSLDLVDQARNLDMTGQFRFTPPTHTMLAFRQALRELEEEGGPAGRLQRYQKNHALLREHMRRLGFRELVAAEHQAPIITTYYYPKDDQFDFEKFYQRLSDKDQVIYPGKVTEADCFRIGNIGHIFPEDIDRLAECIEQVCKDMGMSIPVKSTRLP